MQIKPIRTIQDYHSAIAALALFNRKTALTQDESDYVEVMQVLIRSYYQDHSNEVEEPNRFTYDLDRMKQHVECASVTMPTHIRTAAEIKSWLLANE